MAELAPTTGIPAPILSIAIGRQSFGVGPLTEKVPTPWRGRVREACR